MWIKEKMEREAAILHFYGKVIPSLVGRKYHSPRGYGHAEYEILGGHGEWRGEGDRQKVYAEVGGIEVCLVVKRLGGYDGKPYLPSLQDILHERELVASNTPKKFSTETECKSCGTCALYWWEEGEVWVCNVCGQHHW